MLSGFLSSGHLCLIPHLKLFLSSCGLNGLNDLNNLIVLKKSTDPDDLIIPSTQMTNINPFCGMDHKKSNFSLILALFLSEAVEASRCQLFENWWMKLKCPLLLKPLLTIVQENSQSFYPSESFRISHFTMRHPVLK